jgi:hypothetical protein
LGWILGALARPNWRSDVRRAPYFVIDKARHFRRMLNESETVAFENSHSALPTTLELQFNMTVILPNLTVGVLALQGAFSEHVQLLRQAAAALRQKKGVDLRWEFIEVRTAQELERCEGLIIPGGESTTISLVAARSGILEPLREFVKQVSLATDVASVC